MSNMHDEKGRFAPGNPGGPGRPRRVVERDYVSIVADVCPPERWRRIVERTVTDAEAGDPKAREWLGKHLTGKEPESLLRIARKDAQGKTVEMELQEWLEKQKADERHQAKLKSIMDRLDENDEAE